MESYFKKCGMCTHLNLYDKYGGKFKCTYYGHYDPPTDAACSKFEPDKGRSPEDIENARDGRY